MSGRGREALLNVCEWSGGPRKFKGVVGRRSRMSGNGWEALGDLQERSGGPLGCSGVVGRTS